MSSQRDVLIIGGGVIGLTTAWFLANDGVKVTVVDRGDFGQESSWAGAGIIYPGNPRKAKTGFDKLLAISTNLHRAIATDLREEAWIDNGFSVCGGIELCSGVTDEMIGRWRDEEINFRLVAKKDLPDLEPAFSAELEDGYYLPDMAQVRNPRHLRALVAVCDLSAVEMIPHCPIQKLEFRQGRITAANSDRGRLVANQYLIASGAWTDSLLRPLGWLPGIKPIRGQIVLFRAEKPLFRTILSQGKCYLVPRDDGRILAGSTEEDVGFVKENTPDAVAHLAQMARTFVPALANVPVERTWSGLRPATPDELPYLGRVPNMDNLFLAAGHFRYGIMTSPATAVVMSELLRGLPPSIPLDDFALERKRVEPL